MATVAQAEAREDSRAAVRAVTDRAMLRVFLERDRLFAAYALCDLDDREFSRTRWGMAFEADDPIALVLEYAGLAPQPLFVMGELEGISAILRELIRPRVAYVATATETLPAIERHYRVDPGPGMVRMWVDRTTFRPYPGAAGRLLPAEIGDLNRLYDLGFTTWLPPSAIGEGVYYGIRARGQLVAAAGTHVISREARLGVVGNVMTHQDFRGRGYAKTTTSAVTQELLRFADQVVLNVRADNQPALAAYRALGFAAHCTFEERLVHRRASAWDGIMASLRRFFPIRTES